MSMERNRLEENKSTPTDEELALFQQFQMDPENREELAIFDEITSQSEMKEIEPLSSTDELNWDLSWAVRYNHLEEALSAIQKGAQVNTFYTYYNSYPSLPLHIAAAKLNFEMIKLLLEHGADPNILSTDKESITEILLLQLGLKILNELYGKTEKYTPTLFKYLHLNWQKTRSIKLQNEEIVVMQKIFDLLLCYGLNPNPVWTHNFMSGNTQVSEGLKLKDSTLTQKAKIKSLLESEFIEFAIENTYFVKRSYTTRFLAKTGSWLTKGYLYFAEKNEDRTHSTREYLETIKNFPENLRLASESIRNDKNLFIASHQQKLQQLYDLHRLNIFIINLILDYSLEISKEVSAMRRQTNHIFPFWQSTPVRNALTEAEKEIFIETFKASLLIYKSCREIFASLPKEQTDELSTLIAEYALEPNNIPKLN